MQKSYQEKMSENSAIAYYKKFMTGVENFDYGGQKTNINKSIFALWGVYDDLESKSWSNKKSSYNYNLWIL